jgi:uncharacterized protein YraI
MKNRQIVFTLGLFVFAALLPACGGQGVQAGIETAIAQTRQVSGLQTAAAQPQASATETKAAETVEATPSIPLVSVSTDTNCRTGPRLDYSHVVTIPVGQEVEVVAIFPGNEYVVVKRPDGNGECWLWLRYADRTDFSSYGLPVATQPPTPTPTKTPIPTSAFNWSGSWTVRFSNGFYSGSISQSGNSISGSFTDGSGVINVSGSQSNGGQNVTGSWEFEGGGNGSFQWLMASNTNQFSGSFEGGTEPFCGWRGGASEPGSCLWP